MNNFTNKLDKFWGISKKGSNMKTEMSAGLTTFMTMCYILIVNSGMLGIIPNVSFGAIFIATAISACIGTLMMAFYARMPFAQAPGMGLNAFFVFTVVLGTSGLNLSYGNGLAIVLLSGVLFLLLTVVGVREKIVTAIPECLKIAIPAGIGLFIAFIGMKNANIIVGSNATFVKLTSFTDIYRGGSIKAVLGGISAITAILSFILIAILNKKNVKGAIIFGILGGTILYYILQLICFKAVGTYQAILDETGKVVADKIQAIEFSNPIDAFKAFGKESFFAISFKGLFSGGFKGFITVFTMILSFAIVDMFDTIGTLIGTSKKAGMLDKNGKMENMNKALMCDSVATIGGALLGTSSVTTYVESSAGIAQGGKTGMTSFTVAILFLVSMFLTPIASLIPSAATAAALMYVGVLMIGSLKELDFTDPAIAAPAFMTVIGMPLTYSIADGIGLGVITYVVVNMLTGKIKKINPFTYVIAGIFILKFFIL